MAPLTGMPISVVVPTYNREATLRVTLEALKAQDYANYETIVVDDGSTDKTCEMVGTAFPGVRYIRQDQRGPAAARNAGIQAAAGEIVAFTDDDCAPPRDFLSRLADGYGRHPEVAGVGGYLEAPADVLAQNALAQYEYFISHKIYAAGDREIVGGYECPAGGTNSMSYRKTALDQVGGFDESFPHAAGEDADLKWRICHKGCMLLYVPVRVVHLQVYTWPQFRKQQIRHGQGSVHFERKYGHLPSNWRLLMRAAKRGLLFIPDVPRVGPQLAWIKLWAGWYECRGAWTETRKLRAAS